MLRKRYKMVEVSKLKFSIERSTFSLPKKEEYVPGHVWCVIVTPPDCYYRYLQWLDNGDLRLGYTIGKRTRADKFFSAPGWYRTRSQARMIVRYTKTFFNICCEM